MNRVFPTSQVYDLSLIQSPFWSHDSFFSGFCPDLRQISNGQVIETRPNIGHSAVEFRCDEKFRLVGRPRLECIDGRWNGNLPFCESKLSLQSIAFISILKAKVSNLVGDNCYTALRFIRNLDSTLQHFTDQY